MDNSNSASVSPDRGSTLVLIDDVSSSADRPATSQTTTTTASRAGLPTHPPDPLLYGLQTMEWRPWLRPTPGSSSAVHEYAKSSAANDDYSSYNAKSKKNGDYDGEDGVGRVVDMHGIGPCRRTAHWLGKVFWTLVLLAATGGLSYQLYKTVDDFWLNGSIWGSYTIQTNPSSGSIQFPDIYLCPTNPINETYRRRRRTDTRWFQMLSALQQKSNPDGILGKLFVDWDYLSQQQSGVMNGVPSGANSTNSVDPQVTNPISPLDDTQSDPSPYPLNIDSMRDYFMRNGYDPDAFLVECSFRSKSFKCSDVAQAILDHKHGKCFLFPFSSGNWAWPNSLTVLGGMSSGTSNASWRVSNGVQGFSVAINIHTELYPKENGSLYDGVYLYVDWRTDPTSTFQTKPILLPPGAYSTVSLEAREIRTRKLFSNCMEDETDTERRGERHNWMVLNNPQYYKEELCKFDCLLQTIVDTCHCILLIDAKFINRSALILERRPINDTGDQFSSASPSWTPIGYCTTEQLAGCVYDILQQYDGPNVNKTNCTRQCRPSCRRKQFTLVSNTNLKLPAESYLGSGPNYPFPWNELKNNYVIVDMVLEKGRVTVIEEGPAMNLETFLGVVGGQMSLFLGCSVLTIIQLVVLFLSCCKYSCQRVYRGKCLTLRKTLRKMRHSSLLK